MSRIPASLLLLFILPTPVALAASAEPVNLDTLTTLAQQQAALPWNDEARAVPDFLNELGYDEYRDFKYKPELMLWHSEELPFELEFFHPGYLYKKSVAMHVLDGDGEATPVPFAPELFEYGPQADLLPLLPEDGLDFSGFHVFHRNAEGELARVGLFQGASYYRMVSALDEYGLSARALAVNTTAPDPEEFPDFTTFWFRKPAADDTELVFFGLAEGPSLVAAYEFVLTPGTPIRLQVNGRVVLRRAVQELGLAPFSTMFWYAENTARRPADFRPEVHDSDGLFIETASERSWRPLANPSRTRTDILPGNELQAFGLLQRDRDYEHYQDIEADYHLRPDAWVVPGTAMQQGTLRLLEIESPHEYADNVALLWTPADLPVPGEVFAYDYEVYFGERPPSAVAEVVATRYGESLRGDGSIEFVIDLRGGPLDDLPEDAELEIASEISGGEFVWQNIRRNPWNDTWRLNLRVLPGAEAPADGIRLRAAVHQDTTAVSETWTYWWYP